VHGHRYTSWPMPTEHVKDFFVAATLLIRARSAKLPAPEHDAARVECDNLAIGFPCCTVLVSDARYDFNVRRT